MDALLHLLKTFALLTGCWIFLSCGGSGSGPSEPESPVPTSVAVVPPNPSVDAVGAEVQFAATVRDQRGREMPNAGVTWTSLDQEVATITASGLATAVSSGTTLIGAAASSSAFGSAEMTVTVKPLGITTGSLAVGVEGIQYSQTLQAEGTTSPLWSVSAGILPAGLSLEAGTGIISGIPAIAGTSTFTIQLSGSGQTVTRELFIFVASGDWGVTFGDDQFALIPAGAFQMGSDDGFENERPVHDVNLTRAFYIQKTEVTQHQWETVMGSNPSTFEKCGPTCPVETVSWNDVQLFIQTLNLADPGKGYRLPTEAEWEYAARASTTGDYGGSGVLDEMGWHLWNSVGLPHIVAQKLPNDWGLFDMHGNVWEWVQDFYAEDYYSISPTDDPQGPGGDLPEKVQRGGAVSTNSSGCRSAFRGFLPLGISHGLTGFRLVRNP